MVDFGEHNPFLLFRSWGIITSYSIKEVAKMKRLVIGLVLAILVLSLSGIPVAASPPDSSNIEKVTFIHYAKPVAQARPVWDDTATMPSGEYPVLTVGITNPAAGTNSEATDAFPAFRVAAAKTDPAITRVIKPIKKNN